MTNHGILPFDPAARLTQIEQRLASFRAPAASGGGFEALLSQATARAGTSASAAGAVRSGAVGVLGMSTLERAAEARRTGTLSATQNVRPPMSSPARSAGQAVVEAARDHLGVPYLWGGTDAEHGFDCSGLVQDAYRRIGVEMPKWSRHQAEMGVEVPSLDEAVPGDVLTFGQPVSHVALYVGDGKMLHAPRTGEVVKIEAIDRPINSIRRIVDDGGAALVPAAAAAATPAAAGTTVASARPVAIDLSRSEAESRYTPLFAAAGARWGVDPELLAAVAEAESAFNPGAVSPVGARGLMQFMPATAAEMGVDPWDPASAIDGAARYLRTSLDQFGSVELAVASYNAGRGAVSRHGGIPPYRETINYVDKVIDGWRRRT